MDDQMLALLRQAMERAYAPYSGFAVGAVVRGASGSLYAGCNVENAAYPQGQCAEASAIGVMIAGGGRRIVAIAVAGPEGKPCPPCGGCRQRIREFAGPDTPILLCNGEGGSTSYRLADLLPNSFGPDMLSA